MKICHLTTVHPRYDTRIFKKECISLKRTGFDVTLLVADGKGDEKGNEVKIIDIGAAKNRFERYVSKRSQLLKKAIEIDADVYHFHDPELTSVGLQLLKKNKKVIYDVHEDVPLQILSKHYIPKFLRPLISKIVKSKENKAVKKFTYVITATDFIANRFLKINKNTIAVKNYPIIDNTKNYQQDWENKKDEVCYIGSISKVRGITEMVKALEFANVTMNLGGNFTSNKLETETKKMKGWEKIKYYGFVNKEQAVEIYNRSKIGLVTLHPVINYIDALPVKLFEYMLAGIPVISSDIPLWKEIVEGINCGICVNPLNPKEITDAINYLKKNDKEAKQMGVNGRNAVLEKYNWHNEECKLIEIYNNL